MSNLGAAGGGDEATQELAAAVESLPKLLEQKKGLEMHTNILKVRQCMLEAKPSRDWVYRHGVRAFSRHLLWYEVTREFTPNCTH